MDTAKIIATYHTAAITIDKIITLPIFLSGILISSAACGITSKPKNIKGVITVTLNTPLYPSSNKGCILFTSPFTADKAIKAMPMAAII